MNVVYQDNHLIIVEKRSGVLTQPTQLCHESLETEVYRFLQKQKGLKTPFLKPIHRLDKEVSGLVIFAVSSKGLLRMTQMMKERQVKKVYIAEVEGKVAKPSGVLTHYLEKQEFKAKIYRDHKKKAKEAILEYATLEQSSEKTRLEVQLHTGRYHQIRAQLSFIGHPIIGDHKYGSKKIAQGIHLHHSRLEFIHPVTKEALSITLPCTRF